jgi:mono/diheme cytochrome c family protein
LSVVVPVQAQTLPDSLPKGVTKLMIAEGKGVYRGNGICAVCHGRDAKGLANLGNGLTDDEWAHGDGTYEGIVKTLREGAWAKSGTAMPHQRATTLTDDQLLAVAAYVWSLRFGDSKPSN